MLDPTGPLVSVLMSVYNGEPYLSATLASILGQSYDHIELYVLDDGSLDSTWQVLSQAAADNRVRLLRHEHNQGVPASMNRLFGMANGKYVNRHDADDLSHPDRLLKQVQFLEANPKVGLVGTRVQLIDAEDEPLDRPYFATATTNAEIQVELLHSNCLCQGSVMFRRQLLDEVGAYESDNIGSEDYDLWLRMAEVTELAMLDEVLYHYRIHGNSFGHRQRYEQTYYSARSIERAVERRFGRPAPPERLRSAARLYVQAAIGSFAAGKLESARQWLRHSLELDSGVLGEESRLRVIVSDFTAHVPTEAGLLFVDQVFTQLLPRTARLSSLHRHLISELHMRFVFSPEPGGEPRIDAHLWRGVRMNPTWLLNRGVLARLARSVMRPHRPPLSPESDRNRR
jgi:glycosyltransferase involved in cell wall biosynthesis